MTIAVDFDGTLVEHKYPKIGKEIPFAFEVLKLLQAENHQLILWSAREGRLLDEAVAYCHERGIDFYAVNRHYPEAGGDGHHGNKVIADCYIDDHNLGGLPDWGLIYAMIHYNLTYAEAYERMSKGAGETSEKKKKRKWF